MKGHLEKKVSGLGMVAIGTSPHWEITIDEATDQENAWICEIEGPNIYLVFQLTHLKIIPKMLEFLQSGFPKHKLNGFGKGEREKDSLLLGKFGKASVSLVWDNEDFLRCFLVVGPRAKSTLRVSFLTEDIKMVINILKGISADLGDSSKG